MKIFMKIAMIFAMVLGLVVSFNSDMYAANDGYVQGSMQMGQPVFLGQFVGCKGGPVPFSSWPRDNARIVGNKVILGSGSNALVYHTMVERGTHFVTGVSTASGIGFAKVNPYKIRNARAFYVPTNKNMRIYIESYSAPDINESSDFAIRGVTKEGKAYTFANGLDILKNYFDLDRSKKVVFGGKYPQFAYVQGNQVTIPFAIVTSETGRELNRGLMQFNWDNNAQWFSVAVQ